MFKLDQGEHIQLVVRRHIFPLVLESAFLLLFVLVPIVLYYSTDFIAGLFDVQTGGREITYLFLFFYSGILLLAWLMFFVIWTNYYLDILIVTEKRIIDIEQIRFFAREIATVHMENIQDITVEIKGLIPTLLNYGTLHVQSAGESREFMIREIPNPEGVKKMVYDLHSKELDKPQEVVIKSGKS